MTYVQTIALRPGYEITRVVRGGWQLAGGHGPIDRDRAVEDLVASFDAGITTYDCADIYTGVEELLGAFRGRVRDLRGEAAARMIHVHTKFVPDLSALATLNRAYVESIIDRSLQRLRMERLDIVQFHWWDYEIAGLIETVGWLDDLRRSGKIRHVGLTNFDVPRLNAILKAGVEIVSAQVQYSALDHRPENGFAELCGESEVWLLCYGSVAGGFLSDRWLGALEPTQPLENRSLVKYKLIIDDFGGWDLFQALLRALRAVADRRGVDIATIASRYVLDMPGVAAVIVGARHRAHAAANAQIPAIELSAADKATIEAVIAQSNGPLGDIYALERDIKGRHGSIMHYDNNAKA
jgi:aryl-alcohol dehydrogenase-like predicted oxidoreductase